MITVRARVRNGRLVVDEPTDLPDGTEIDLVADGIVSGESLRAWLRNVPPAEDHLSELEVAELDRMRREGAYVAHEDLRKKLARRKP